MSEAGGVDIPVTLSVAWQYDGSGQEAATAGMHDYYDSIEGTMSSLSRLTSTFQLLEMQSMRQQMMEQMMEASVLRVTVARERYNEALQRFGEHSKQATSAHAQLEIAMLQEHRAQERLNMMQLRNYLEILPIGTRVMEVAHAMILRLTGQTTAHTAATVAHTAASGVNAEAQGANSVAQMENTGAREAATVVTEEQTTAEVAQQAMMGPAGWASLAIGVGVMGGMLAYQINEQNKMNDEIKKQTALMDQAAGGGGATLGSYQEGTTRVPVTGKYQLHEGESVLPAGGEIAGAGDVHLHVHMQGYSHMDVRQMSHQMMEEVEREKRRRYPQKSRTF